MLTLDQIIAGLLVIMGLFAGLSAILLPAAGAVVTVILYLIKLLRGPFRKVD